MLPTELFILNTILQPWELGKKYDAAGKKF